jgi:hypothetical protein
MPVKLEDLVDAVVKSGQRIEIKIGDGRSLFLVSRKDVDRLTDLDIETNRKPCCKTAGGTNLKLAQ